MDPALLVCSVPAAAPSCSRAGVPGPQKAPPPGSEPTPPCALSNPRLTPLTAELRRPLSQIRAFAVLEGPLADIRSAGLRHEGRISREQAALRRRESRLRRVTRTCVCVAARHSAQPAASAARCCLELRLAPARPANETASDAPAEHAAETAANAAMVAALAVVGSFAPGRTFATASSRSIVAEILAE